MNVEKNIFVKIFVGADLKNARRASKSRRVALLSTRALESDPGANLGESPLFIGIPRGGFRRHDVKIVSGRNIGLQRRYRKSAENHVRFWQTSPKVLADTTCGFCQNHVWSLPEPHEKSVGTSRRADRICQNFFLKS